VTPIMMALLRRGKLRTASTVVLGCGSGGAAGGGCCDWACSASAVVPRANSLASEAAVSLRFRLLRVDGARRGGAGIGVSYTGVSNVVSMGVEGGSRLTALEAESSPEMCDVIE
jgi:hypothetical protein